MTAQEVGSAKGLFSTASGGRAFAGKRFRRKPKLGALDRFADELSKHIDQGDIEAGRGSALDPGGDPRACARKIGARPEQGQIMLRRICRKLGPQAC